MQSKIVITIEREFGSGGREIARKVAEKLGIKMYDKELIALIAKESGMSEDVLREVDETVTNSFLHALSSGAYSGSNLMALGVNNIPITDKAFISCSQIIKDIVSKESCVIVGRCAEYILRDEENTLSVFIHADVEKRIDRICEHDEVSRDKALSIIKRADKARANYHNYYSDTRWGSRSAYDLCINSKVGLDTAADIIKLTAEQLNNM